MGGVRTQGAGHVEIDVCRLVAQVYELIRTDPQLSDRLGLSGMPGDWATARGLRVANLVMLGLDRLIDEALGGRVLAAENLARLLRRRRVTEDDYDRLAHYLLTVALAHRVGPDNLLRIGAALTAIRMMATRSDVR
jgi:hypothetical protein